MNRRTRTRVLVAAALAVVVTVAVGFFFLNLSLGDRLIDHSIATRYAVGDDQFRRSMGSLLGPSIREGNHVTSYQNGDEIFPAMLGAIRGAQQSVTFETYIYWSGEIGRQFEEALTERASAGVPVHVLVDWVGSIPMESELFDRMQAAGVDIVRYRPLHWYSLARFANRTHRKLLVVDGTVGFTGGVGIADAWLGAAQDTAHWRDSHFRLEGPAVAQMQAAFMNNWMQARADVLHDTRYFPVLAPKGDMPAQVFSSSPGGGSENVRLMYLLSFASARESIRISAAYFVPDEVAIASLVAARERGVVVEIVLPGKQIDAAIVRKASRARWGDLLRAGVVIYEYQPTMYHCKVMIVDDKWVSVGSTNLDARSLRFNDETNLNVLDEGLAATLRAVFEDDKAKSRVVTLEMWNDRPWTDKVVERAASLLGWQL